MLATCCTHCGTRFRVTAAQLQARQGQVRCGRCNEVFNALETLDATAAAGAGALPPQAATQPYGSPADKDLSAAGIAHDKVIEDVPVSSATGAEEHMVSPVSEGQAAGEAENNGTIGARGDAMADGVALPSEAAGDETAVTEPSMPDSSRSAVAQVTEMTMSAEPAPSGPADTSVSPSRPDARAMDEDNPFAPASGAALPARRSHPLLAMGSFVLLLLVAAQGLYFYRGELAARFPATRDLLTRACEPLRCSVSLPRRPEAIVIEASDLQATDASAPGRIRLTATLRNHAAHVVAFPALDLVLTNVNDHTLARRVFLPAEYLDTASAAAAGLAPKAEATVRLTLDTGELGAAGFRLAVLAAPLPK